MPRNSQGLYTLPAGNPVVPDTLIESTWANPTMEDIALALTGSLPRNGSAPMTGPLTLAGMPVSATQAASKAYVDQFIAASTGMPLGAIAALAGSTVPAGWLLCDGSAVSRTTYAALFTTIGTIYGAGDGSTTFNVPDLRNKFVRGVGSKTGVLGTAQDAELALHGHAVNDPAHSHGHTHTFGGTTADDYPNHSHGITDPGHQHDYEIAGNTGGSLNTGGASSPIGTKSVTSSLTGITQTNGVTNVHQHGFSGTTSGDATPSATGITVGATGGTETRPENVAMNYYIKAVEDSSAAITPVLGITSSDTNMISIDETTPSLPELVVHSNVAFGTVKLDASGKIPQSLVNVSTFQYLGPYDASSGENPSQAHPTEVFANGDLYQISVGGTILLHNAAGVPSMTPVVSTDQIAFVTGSTVGLPEGWYFQPTTTVTGVTAGAVSFVPTGSIASTNVQNAIVEVANESTPSTHVGSGGSQHANVVAGGAAGFMSGSDKTKLDGIAANAQVNTVFSVNGQTGSVSLTAADVGALTQSGGDARYVNVSGDSMSGNLSVPAVLASAAQDGSANALTRKDYVDGNFMPTAGNVYDVAISGGCSAESGVLSDAAWDGHYTRIGKMVIFRGIARVVNAGSGAGLLILNGTPFTSKRQFQGSGRLSNGVSGQIYVQEDATYMVVCKWDNTSLIQSGESITFSIVYYVY